MCRKTLLKKQVFATLLYTAVLGFNGNRARQLNIAAPEGKRW